MLRGYLSFFFIVLGIMGTGLWGYNVFGLQEVTTTYLLDPLRSTSQQKAVLPVQTHVNQSLPVPMILGYYYNPGNGTSGYASLKAYRHVLTGIIPFWYTLHRNGSVTGKNDPKVIRFATAHHLWVFALVQNMKGAPVYSAFLKNPIAEQKAINNLLALVEKYGYDGLNLDLEGVPPKDRQRFTHFVAMLANTLHHYGYYLTLSVPAETANNPQNTWSGAYSYRKLGKIADLIMIMAYDQHGVNSQPGSIAGQRWVKQVVSYATHSMPSSKIILGIATYGYNWTTNHGTTALSWFQAASLAKKYDPKHLSHFKFTKNGISHQVYYENSKTYSAKQHVVIGYDLRGIALWRLGIEDPKIWQVIRP